MRSGRTLSASGVVAGGLAIVGPLLANVGAVKPLTGFVLFALGGLLAVVLGIGAIVRLVRGRGLTAGGAVSLLVAATFLGLVAAGSGHPRINDFTTDVTDPPALRFAATLPPNAGRDLSYPPSFAAVQQQCCGDLQPLHVALPPGEAFAHARRVAETRPRWTVTHADPATSTVEAVATSKLFHFQDDVVIRIRPAADGQTILDVRSKSRDGQGDFGVNAARIRDFVAAFRTDAGAG
jgi:uncharacterized protein (DUF1499 family)